MILERIKYDFGSMVLAFFSELDMYVKYMHSVWNLSVNPLKNFCRPHATNSC